MTEIQNESPNDFLEHFGIKGMKWGVRRSRQELARARNEKIAKEDSEDAAKARAISKKIQEKGGRTNTLSNSEMQLLINRMNLERNYNNMMQQQAEAAKKNSSYNKGKRAVAEVMSLVDTANKVAKVTKPMRDATSFKTQSKSWDWKKDVAG